MGRWFGGSVGWWVGGLVGRSVGGSVGRWVGVCVCVWGGGGMGVFGMFECHLHNDQWPTRHIDHNCSIKIKFHFRIP